MRIGIYLAYDPNTKLRKEGLGRYLGGLMSAFVKSGHKVTVACPEWLLQTLNDLMHEFRIDSGRIDFIVSGKKPAARRLFDMLKSRRAQRTYKRSSRYKKLCSIGDRLITLLASVPDALFGLILLVLLAVGIFALPFLLLFTGFYLIRWLTKRLLRKQENVVISLKNKLNPVYRRFSDMWRSIVRDKLLKKTEKKLVRKINSSRQNVPDVWFSPAAFWKGFSKINGTLVLNVPDLVTGEYTSRWADYPGIVADNDAVKETILACKNYITYCEYLKTSLLVDRFGVSRSSVRVIPHAINDMMPYIRFDKALSEKMNIQNMDATTNYARSILNNLWLKNDSVRSYIREFSFKDVHYIFYASQNRPYKNILTLIKAYEYLLRRKYCNVKLILTGNIVEDKLIWQFVVKERLQFDVISFINVTAQELAALYRCADLVVNPTLYEGGFPFTFGEGMSVGTPSLMSDIPQTRDVIEPAGIAADMLFDPYDWLGLAEKMHHAIAHREELYQKELPLYHALEQRTSGVMAKEYIDAFAYFIERDREKKTG